MAFALTSGGPLSALLGFLIFAATMVALMGAVALVVGLSEGAALRRLRAAGAEFQRVAGGVLVAVGAGLVYFTLQAHQFRRLFFP